MLCLCNGYLLRLMLCFYPIHSIQITRVEINPKKIDDSKKNSRYPLNSGSLKLLQKHNS